MSQSYNLLIAETIRIWAVPLSLATTQGITIVFSSSGYLDVSVLRVCFLPITRENFRPSAGRVSPFGNPRIKRLFAPPRGLSQLITSFIASESQGIHHTLLITFFVTYNLLHNFFQHVKELHQLTAENEPFSVDNQQVVMKQPNVFVSSTTLLI